MKPRDYQEYATNTIFDYFVEHKGNPLIVMPTGVGKSIVIGDFTRKAIHKYPNTRVMILTHVKELLEQNLDKLLQLWPTAPAGLYSAGLKRKDTFYPITFGGIASVSRIVDFKVFGRVDLLLIDEAQLVSPKDESMYGYVIAELRKLNSYLKVVGFTATDYRLGHGKLTDGKHLFTDVCCDMSKRESFNWFIDQGYLVPLVPKRPQMEIDTSNIHMRGGEYIEAEAQAAADKEELTFAACNEMIRYGSDRNHWLTFSSGIQHAENICNMLNSLGVDATFIHSKISEGERDKRILQFKEGRYRAMVNNGILTTGYDDCEIDLINMLRLTQSPGLFVQMLGRGTRPNYVAGYDLLTKEGRLASIAASDKKNCLVLDFAGNTRRLGPINDPVIPSAKGNRKGEAPIKICEACSCYNHASVRFCTHCGEEFAKHLKIKSKAYTDELIAGARIEPLTDLFEVDRITYDVHKKQGRPDSLRITYYCGLRRFREYACFEHGYYPAKKAWKWWQDAAGSVDTAPATVEDAMKRIDQLRKPKKIRVWVNKDNPEVMNYEY